MPKAQPLYLLVQNITTQRILVEAGKNSFIALPGKGLGSLARSFIATDHGEVADKIEAVCSL